MDLVVDILQIAFALLVFGFIIFWHELGHLLAGMWRKMHIDRFSVGFGPPIWKTTVKGIEYWLSWIPLGGYVMLPQIDVTDKPQTLAGDPLPVAKPLDRIIVAAAGPLFNVALGFLLSLVVWKGGIMALPYSDQIEIDYVDPTSPEYAAGLRAGDVITEVNGKGFRRGWEQVRERIIYAPNKHMALTVLRDGAPQTISYDLAPNANVEGLFYPNFDATYDVQVHAIMENAPAVGKLEAGDVITELNGTRLTSISQLQRLVRAGEEGQAVTLTVLRRQSDGSMGRIPSVVIVPAATTVKEKVDKWLVGIAFSPISLWVEGIEDGTPAATAGVHVGDGILGVNDEYTLTPDALRAALQTLADSGEPVTLRVLRGSAEEEIPLALGNTPGTENVIRNLTGMTVEYHRMVAAEVAADSPALQAGVMPGDVILKLGGEAVQDDSSGVERFIARIQKNKDKPIDLVVLRDGVETALTLTPHYTEYRESTELSLGILPQQRRVKVYPEPQEQFLRTVDQVQTMLRQIANRDNPISFRHMSTFPGIAAIMKSSLSEDFLNFLHLVVFINFMLALVNLLPFPVLDGGQIVIGTVEGVSGRKLPVGIMVWVQKVCFTALILLMVYILVFDTNRVGKWVGRYFEDRGTTTTIEQPKTPEAPPPAADPADADTRSDSGTA